MKGPTTCNRAMFTEDVGKNLNPKESSRRKAGISLRSKSARCLRNMQYLDNPEAAILPEYRS